MFGVLGVDCCCVLCVVCVVRCLLCGVYCWLLIVIGWWFVVGGLWLLVLGVWCLLFVAWCLLRGVLVVIGCLVGGRWLSIVLLDVVGWLMVDGWVIVCCAVCVIRSVLRATLHGSLFSVSGWWLLVVVCC